MSIGIYSNLCTKKLPKTLLVSTSQATRETNSRIHPNQKQPKTSKQHSFGGEDMTDEQFENLNVTNESKLTRAIKYELSRQEAVDAIWKWLVSRLTSPASSGQKVVNVVDGSLFTVGYDVLLRGGSNCEKAKIAAINGNQLTMEENLEYTYDDANAKVEKFKPDGFNEGDHHFKLFDSDRNTEVNTFMINIDEDPDFSPIKVVDKGFIVKKDVSVGGFVSSGQGILYLGSGFTQTNDPPQIVLAHGGSLLSENATQGTDTITVGTVDEDLGYYGMDIGNVITLKDDNNHETLVIKSLDIVSNKYVITTTTNLVHNYYTAANAVVKNFDTLHLKQVNGLYAHLKCDEIHADEIHADKLTATEVQGDVLIAESGAVKIKHGYASPGCPPCIILTDLYPTLHLYTNPESELHGNLMLNILTADRLQIKAGANMFEVTAGADSPTGNAYLIPTNPMYGELGLGTEDYPFGWIDAKYVFTEEIKPIQLGGDLTLYPWGDVYINKHYYPDPYPTLKLSVSNAQGVKSVKTTLRFDGTNTVLAANVGNIILHASSNAILPYDTNQTLGSSGDYWANLYSALATIGNCTITSQAIFTFFQDQLKFQISGQPVIFHMCRPDINRVWGVYNNTQGRWKAYLQNSNGSMYVDGSYGTFSPEVSDERSEIIEQLKHELEKPSVERDDEGRIICHYCKKVDCEDAEHLKLQTEKFAKDIGLVSLASGKLVTLLSEEIDALKSRLAELEKQEA